MNKGFVGFVGGFVEGFVSGRTFRDQCDFLLFAELFFMITIRRFFIDHGYIFKRSRRVHFFTFA